ncbi:hypothetical protein Pfo_022593 [Paulownia fortunei]|nr:hypothetical protein Pfo_022593 [Paulownia fortunei]
MAVIETQYTKSGDVGVLLELALPPDQLAWCGMYTLSLYWDDMLFMVGPYGDLVCYIYDEPILLIPDCNVVRKLSKSADENLRLIHSSLPEAVEACIDAAGYEFDTSLQWTLLRAQKYGQAFSRFQKKGDVALKVFALATIRDWDALAKFSKEKGQQLVCVDADEKGEALKYVSKLNDPT